MAVILVEGQGAHRIFVAPRWVLAFRSVFAEVAVVNSIGCSRISSLSVMRRAGCQALSSRALGEPVETSMGQTAKQQQTGRAIDDRRWLSHRIPPRRSRASITKCENQHAVSARRRRISKCAAC